jgi:ribose transport system substrate-binding protein
MEKTLEVLEKYPGSTAYLPRTSNGRGRNGGVGEDGKRGKSDLLFDRQLYSADEALENGTINGFAVQMPFNMGYMAIKVAVDAYNGNVREENVDTGFAFATRENMYKEEIQKLIYPFS